MKNIVISHHGLVATNSQHHIIPIYNQKALLNKTGGSLAELTQKFMETVSESCRGVIAGPDDTTIPMNIIKWVGAYVDEKDSQAAPYAKYPKNIGCGTELATVASVYRICRADKAAGGYQNEVVNQLGALYGQKSFYCRGPFYFLRVTPAIERPKTDLVE